MFEDLWELMIVLVLCSPLIMIGFFIADSAGLGMLLLVVLGILHFATRGD